MDANWVAPKTDPAAAVGLAGALGLHPVMGQLLINRGFRTGPEALEFLKVDLSAPPPLRLEGVRPAAWRMLQAVRHGEPVVVYGDYDADGQTSSAILIRALRLLGASVRSFIPHRLSLGYGLHEEVLLEMAHRGVRLVVAVDCGLTANDAIASAKASGLDVVVVDHHEPSRRPPPAAAIVAAHRQGRLSGGREMSAAGLAYHTARALLDLAGALTPEADDELVQLAALGTVADVVSLVGENRRLVRRGLSVIRIRPLPGLERLAAQAGIDLSAVDTHHLAFILAPRLNAAGRVDDPSVGLSLLLASTPDEAALPAQQLDVANRTRQETERRVLDEAVRRADAAVQAEDPPILVVSGVEWHPGVIGIVASRLVDRFSRPALVVAVEGDEARGSGRSVPGLNLHEALAGCSSFFTRFGGHPMAAGFSLKAKDLPEFTAAVVEQVRRLWSGPCVRQVALDAWARLPDVTLDLARQLSLLEPHGEGNPRPLIGIGGLQLAEARPVGQDGRHLRLSVRDPESGTEAYAIAFGKAEAWRETVGRAASGELVDMAVMPQIGRFDELELRALELRPAELPDAGVVTLPEEHEPGRGFEAGGADAGGPGPGPVADEAVAAWTLAQPAVVDRRGLADGGLPGFVSWLRERASGGGIDRGVPSVVAVRHWRMAVTLTSGVWEHAEELAGAVSWEPPLEVTPDPRREGGAGGLFGARAVRVVWTPTGLERAGPVDTLLFWELPLEVDAWATAAARAGVARVILAFGDQERSRLEREILATFPTIDALRYLYRLLVAQVRVAGPELPANPGRLARVLSVLDAAGTGVARPPELQPQPTPPAALGRAQAPPPPLHPEFPAVLVQRALDVFEDVGLVRRDPVRGTYAWHGPQMGEKLDLTQSARYNQLMRARSRWEQLLETAFQHPADALWSAWTESRMRLHA